MCDTSKVSKFKAGDKVCKAFPGKQVESWETHEYVTVDYVDGDRVYAKETNTWVAEGRVKFYGLSTRAKREELEAAIMLVQSYNVQLVRNNSLYIAGSTSDYNLPKLLEKLLPLESPAQKKLKELEDQQRELANQMEKLRSEL